MLCPYCKKIRAIAALCMVCGSILAATAREALPHQGILATGHEDDISDPDHAKAPPPAIMESGSGASAVPFVQSYDGSQDMIAHWRHQRERAFRVAADSAQTMMGQRNLNLPS